METWDHILGPAKLAFERHAFVRFIGALNTIFGLAVARELFDYFKDATRHIPTDGRPKDNNISDFEFVEWHQFQLLRGLIPFCFGFSARFAVWTSS
jgi:hypothetical protein